MPPPRVSDEEPNAGHRAAVADPDVEVLSVELPSVEVSSVELPSAAEVSFDRPDPSSTVPESPRSRATAPGPAVVSDPVRMHEPRFDAVLPIPVREPGTDDVVPPLSVGRAPVPVDRMLSSEQAAVVREAVGTRGADGYRGSPSCRRLPATGRTRRSSRPAPPPAPRSSSWIP